MLTYVTSICYTHYITKHPRGGPKMNNRTKGIITIAFTSLFLIPVYGHTAEQEKHDAKAFKLDTTAIEKAIGKAGELKDEVYKISMPRTDLKVMVKDITLKPGLAL